MVGFFHIAIFWKTGFSAPVLHTQQGDLLPVFLKNHVFVHQQFPSHIGLDLFEPVEVGSFFILAFPGHVVAVIMIAQGGVYAHGCIQLAEYIDQTFHLMGGVVDKVAGKKNKVRFLIQNFLNAFLHRSLINEATRVYIGDVNDLQSFKCSGQVAK